MPAKHNARLTDDQRDHLDALIRTGRSHARVLRATRGPRPLDRAPAHRSLRRPRRRARLARRAGEPRDRAPGAQKNTLKPHRVKAWVIPPKQSAAFAADMERVLDLYAEPYDPARPVVCFDERPCALVGEVEGRPPLPMRPGIEARQDHEYVRG